MSEESSSRHASTKLSPDERAELERRLGDRFRLDGSFGSLWAVELLLRTVRRVTPFRGLVQWLKPYLRDLLSRGYREAGFALLDIDESLVSVQRPGFVSNVAEAFERVVSQRPPQSTTALSPVFGMALVPRYGLEAITLGQPWLDERVRYRQEVERLVDWIVAEHLGGAIGVDRELGEAGYQLVRTLIAPSWAYVGADGVDQVKKVAELLAAQRPEREQVLRGLCGSQDLYLAVIAGRACAELGVAPTSEQEARGVRLAMRHFGGLPGANAELRGAVAALLPRKESSIEGVDNPRYAEADRAVQAGAMAKAYDLLDALVRAEPQCAAYWCYRGFVAEQLGRGEQQSYDDYDRSISLQPDYWQALINRGVLLSRNERFDEADRDLFLARALRPDCDDTRNNLLLNYLFRRLGELGPAKEPKAPPPAQPKAGQPEAAQRDAPEPAAGSAAKSGPGSEPVADDDHGDWHMYEVIEPLGEGGMGKVFRVRHLGWGVDLALKIPRVELLERGGVEGFVEEAEAWSRLGVHPHTVDCYYVRMRRGVPWLFAELVDGGSLLDWIESGKFRRKPGESDKQLLGTMIDVALQMTYGLHHAHEHGLIHQDMKPANVMLTKEGIAKVTDFGLAKVTKLAESAPDSGGGRKTLMAGFAGMTPVYCSPEQAAAARSRARVELTRRTDLWSWAVTVLEMFVGSIRWMSGVLAPACLSQYLDEGGWDERIPLMPARLARLLEHCFQRREADRPADMVELGTELRAIYQEVTGARQARPQPEFHDDIAVVLNNRGASMLDIGRAGDARAAWQQALDAEPHHLEATYNLALFEWRAASITDVEAVERMRAAVAAHDSEWRAHLLEAWLHYERADRERSQACCVEALKGTARTKTTMDLVVKPYRACKAGFEIEELLELPSAPRLLAISRDERVVASVHEAGVRVWQLSGKEELHGIDVPARWLSLSSDGALAAAADDSTVVSWPTAGGAALRVPLPGVRGLVVCGDHEVVVAVGERLVAVDCRSGETREIGRAGGTVNGLAAMASGRLIATASDDATVQLRLVDGQVTRTLHHELPVEWVALTADARRAVSGGWDAERSHYRLSLWDTGSGSLIRRLEEPAPRRAVMSDDGRHVLSWDERGSLRLWQVETGRCLRTALPLDSVGAVTCADADPVLIASGARLCRVQVLHGASAAPVMVARPRHSDALDAAHARFRAALERTEAALDQGDVQAAVSYLDEANAVPGYLRHRQAQRLAARIAHRSARSAFRTSWAGRSLRDLGGPVQAVGLASDGSSVLLVVFDAGRRLIEVSRHDASSGERLTVLHVAEATGPFEAAALSPDHGVAVTACGGTLRLWRLERGDSVVIAGQRRPRDLALSRDGSLLFVAEEAGVAIWDIAAERWLDPLAAGDVRAIAVAAAVDCIAVASAESLSLWTLATGRPLRRLTRVEARVERVALTPDGAMAAAVHQGGRVAAIDADAGVSFRAQSVEGGRAVALSPDGGVMIVGDGDGAVLLCDVHAGGKPIRLGSHSNDVLAVAITPDARLVASAGRDGDVKLWHLAWGRLPVAPNALGRARRWLELFLAEHRARAPGSLDRRGEPSWTAADLEALCTELGWLGYGAFAPADLERALRQRLRAGGQLETSAGQADASVVLSEVASGLVLEVPRGQRLSLGRGPGCDLLIRRPLVARLHAEVAFDDQGATVADAGSRLGTELDGRRVEGPTGLAVGAELRLGLARFRVSFRQNATGQTDPSGELDPRALRWGLEIERHAEGRPLGRRERLPVELLLVGDFGGETASWQPLPVNDVDGTMARVAPRLTLSLPASDSLGMAATEVPIELTSMADLAPDRLVRQLEGLARMYFTYIGLGWWEGVADDYADPLTGLIAEVRASVARGMALGEAASEVAEAHGRSIIGRIIPLDHPAYALARGPLAGLLQLLVAHRRERVDSGAVAWAKATIASGLGASFDRVLGDARFRRIERSWRTLAAICESLPAEGAHLHLLDGGAGGFEGLVRNGALQGALASALDRGLPYTAVVLAEPVSEPASALAPAAALVRHHQAVLLAAAAAPDLVASASSVWRAFFDDPAAGNVFLGVSRTLLRAPYRGLQKMPYSEGEVSGVAGSLEDDGALAAVTSLLENHARDRSLRVDAEALSSSADSRAGSRSFAVTLPLSRLAQHLQLMHRGFDRRADVAACKTWLRRWLDELVGQLALASGRELRATLELVPHAPGWLRCDLWLAAAGGKAAHAGSPVLATSMLLATS